MAQDIIKKGKFTFPSGRPMKFPEDIEKPLDGLPEKQKTIVQQVGSTIKPYLVATQELLGGQYAGIREFAPVHMIDPGNILVLCCEEGVIIRYDRKVESSRLAIAWSDETLSELAPKVSEQVVYCHNDKKFISTVPETGPEIILSKVDKSTGQSSIISRIKIGFNVVIQSPSGPLPSPPNKPYCLLSVQNSLELFMEGEMISNADKDEKPKRFLARTPIRMSMGWECIEIFPLFNLDNWKPEFAYLWTERDILASVLTKQLRESKFQTLDPNALARKKFSELLNGYKNLIDSDPEREEILQNFLKENPILLCPTYTKLWPKLPFGSKESDFVFKKASGEYLLVELEKSTDRLFILSGDTSKELKHAQNQLLDWKRYIEDNLSTVQRELGLIGISSNPESLIAIGRSHSLTLDNKRKLKTIQNESPKTKIITYDDVYENAKAVVENLLGPLWGETGNTEIYYLPDK